MIQRVRFLLSIAVGVWAFLFSCALASSASAAEAGRVLVIGGGGTFRDAVAVALNPWNLQVLPADMPAPRGVMPRAAEESRAIGLRFNAVGVVWVSSEDHEHALWIYDAKTEQIVSRAIPTPPPFDAPTAAAFALSVKSLLRASTVAPPEERIGASVAREPSSTDTSHPRPLVPSEGEPDHVAPQAPTTFAPPFLRGEITGAARAIADRVDARVGAGASIWFGDKRRIGVGLEGDFGPGLSVSADRFAGRFNEIGVAPSARYRVPLGRRLDLVPRAGMSFDAPQNKGVVVQTAQAVDESRLDGSLDLGLTIDFAITPALRAGLDLSTSYMLRFQRYLVSDASVFELQPLQGNIGLRLSAGLL
jgi:hypothetical protein